MNAKTADCKRCTARKYLSLSEQCLLRPPLLTTASFSEVDWQERGRNRQYSTSDKYLWQYNLEKHSELSGCTQRAGSPGPMQDSCEVLKRHQLVEDACMVPSMTEVGLQGCAADLA
jgi:hypothetical protein